MVTKNALESVKPAPQIAAWDNDFVVLICYRGVSKLSKSAKKFYVGCGSTLSSRASKLSELIKIVKKCLEFRKKQFDTHI